MDPINDILLQPSLDRAQIIRLLSAESDTEKEQIFARACEVKKAHMGEQIFVRGLIELSNVCRKNCLYCGVRRGIRDVHRYDIPDDEVNEVVRQALEQGYTSLVIQSGERTDRSFIDRIGRMLKKIQSISNQGMRVTLSCGEQSLETYRCWADSGAHRYLLRIETTNRDLYRRIHPADDLHRYDNRIRALQHLKEAGYLVGTGVMIGLPGQSVEDLADDLLFLSDIQVDMVGMGPYIEHEKTPLFKEKDRLWSTQERLEKSLLMIAVLRLLLKDINIASATALDVLSPEGRTLAFHAGASVLMPNITPVRYREDYLIYKDKPVLLEATDLIKRISSGLPSGMKIDLAAWGDQNKGLSSEKA
ncbi:MAG TPA: [FeFe] hydrogenase H-cluster radical SAM maturase HydE [Bacteroidales bacterium]|nr:[FeFe] hydrogenase H-cluster radical SAM maturase HydE [Bacteroidales bacterium]HNS47614.1 [FeFe] hydrogenase H-cluster radical SAM maturase HydE [Bacteroidales bacterium]